MKKFCVISFPIQEAFNKPFFGLLTILNYFSSEVYYITNKDSKIIHNLNKVDKILYNPIF